MAQIKIRASTQVIEGTITSNLLAPELFNSMTTGIVTKRADYAVTANIAALTGSPGPVDGQPVATGMTVLLTGQTTASQNGPWVINTAGAWTRPAWWAAGSIQNSTNFFVAKGDTLHDSEWLVVADDIAVDTTDIAPAKKATVDNAPVPFATLMADSANVPTWGVQVNEFIHTAAATGVGAVDGTNKKFVLTNIPDNVLSRAVDIEVYVNGLRQRAADYTLTVKPATTVPVFAGEIEVELVDVPVAAAGTIPADEISAVYFVKA